MLSSRKVYCFGVNFVPLVCLLSVFVGDMIVSLRFAGKVCCLFSPFVVGSIPSYCWFNPNLHILV